MANGFNQYKPSLRDLPEDRRNALAREMAHTYQGSANALNPVAQGVQNYLAKFGPGYWEGVKDDIEGGLRNQLARAILATSAQSPTLAKSFGLNPSPEEARNAMAEFYAAMPFGTESMGGFAGITAYHGSPHKFDKFRMDKIGTGEGAQAYGHGLYFAENPKVATDYSDKLSGGAFKLKVGNNIFKQGDDPVADYVMGFAGSNRAEAKRGLGDALNKAWHSADLNFPKDQVGAVRGKISEWMAEGGRVHRNTGNLYKVDISDDAVKNFLDWDKPLSQQPESVRKAVQPFIDATIKNANNPEAAYRTTEEALDAIKNDQVTGKILYAWMSRGGRNELATEALNKLGIKGIRYLDQVSRESGKGTSNFVVFDDKIIKVLNRE